jgi:hypothetical protein
MLVGWDWLLAVEGFSEKYAQGIFSRSGPFWKLCKQ